MTKHPPEPNRIIGVAQAWSSSRSRGSYRSGKCVGRSGIVILPGQRTRVRLLLEAHVLLAEDIEHGLELRRILAAPDPKILVNTAEAVAA